MDLKNPISFFFMFKLLVKHLIILNAQYIRLKIINKISIIIINSNFHNLYILTIINFSSIIIHNGSL